MVKLEFIDYGKNYFFIDILSIIKFLRLFSKLNIPELLDIEIGFKSTDSLGGVYLYKIYESIFDLDAFKIEQLNKFLLNQEYLKNFYRNIKWCLENRIWYVHLNIIQVNDALLNKIDNIYNENISYNEKELLKDLGDFWILDPKFILINTSSYFLNQNKTIKLLSDNSFIENRINKRFLFKKEESIIEFFKGIYNYYDQKICSISEQFDVNITYLDETGAFAQLPVYEAGSGLCEINYQKLNCFKECETLEDFNSLILKRKDYKIYQNNFDWYSNIHFWYIDFFTILESDYKQDKCIYNMNKKDYEVINTFYFNSIKNQERIIIKNINYYLDKDSKKINF